MLRDKTRVFFVLSINKSYLTNLLQSIVVIGINFHKYMCLNKMAVLCGMPTIQYLARSARLSVNKLFTSCIRKGLVLRDSIVSADWLPVVEQMTLQKGSKNGDTLRGGITRQNWYHFVQNYLKFMKLDV